MPRSLEKPDVSEEHIASILQSLTHVYADFLIALFFDPEDEGGVPPKHQALSQLHGVTTLRTHLSFPIKQNKAKHLTMTAYWGGKL
jgi:hypothetical protein